jgi:plastocyanin
MIRRAALVLAVLSLMVLGACSEDNEVGSGVKVDKNAAGGNNRLGGTTTTAAPAATTTAAPTATTAPKTATTAPKAATTTAPTATTAPAATAFEITINGDSSGKKQFEPPQAGVRLGTVVRWVNRDSVDRVVESQEAGFQSPTIPPGGSWEYKTEAKGTFNYQDGTRPYAVGVLQVG